MPGARRDARAGAVVNGHADRHAHLDRDGDVDLFASSWIVDEVIWWENVYGDGRLMRPHHALRSSSVVYEAETADVDADCDDDAVVVVRDQLVWLENDTGDASHFVQHPIGPFPGRGGPIALGDLDGDGDLDVVGAPEAGALSWRASAGLATPAAACTPAAPCCRPEGCGDACGSSLEACGGAPLDCAPCDPDWRRHTVAEDLGLVRSLATADVTGDGQLEILAAVYGTSDIAYFVRDDPPASFWHEHTVRSQASGASDVRPVDFDGDGDVDLLCASDIGDATGLLTNASRDGLQWSYGYVGPDALSIDAADFDGDGELDLVAADDFDGTLFWYWTNGIWNDVEIAPNLGDDARVAAADFDGDGDADVFATLTGDERVVWLENAGDGTAWTLHELPGTPAASALAAGDVDGDGDVDAAAGGTGRDGLRYFENTPAGFVVHVVGDVGRSLGTLALANLDGDPELELLCAQEGRIVAWDRGASPDAWTPDVIANGLDESYAVAAGDVDGDGDTDVVASWSAGVIAWWERR